MATGYKLKEVVGVTTSEVREKELCMVAMKFTSKGTRNARDSAL